jgi:hypothetical protein
LRNFEKIKIEKLSDEPENPGDKSEKPVDLLFFIQNWILNKNPIENISINQKTIVKTEKLLDFLFSFPKI